MERTQMTDNDQHIISSHQSPPIHTSIHIPISISILSKSTYITTGEREGRLQIRINGVIRGALGIFTFSLLRHYSRKPTASSWFSLLEAFSSGKQEMHSIFHHWRYFFFTINGAQHRAGSFDSIVSGVDLRATIKTLLMK
ncbi:hypothetical protein EYC80_002598 [Monilinia laxa]|uniref:Uncharacterized protein n=1 Tax=Monilinia laxa TaxID=61186 RepID=A0A5N6K4I9_MONLA|nr:hypothetical protein EYC80_002598 [Monilinia laxa]